MNKNRFEVEQIINAKDGERILLKYIKEPGDPHFDDLPSELLKPGDEVYGVFTPVKKEEEETFNQ